MDRRLSGTGALALPMTRRDIADYLGLTVETVSRELSQLRASGILKFAESSKRQIVLEGRQKLQRLNL
jgi:CRP/FNR family nitrogen fixation transcriptional regulator